MEALRGRQVIHVAVGALHCLAVTSDNQVRSNLYFYTNNIKSKKDLDFSINKITHKLTVVIDM